MMRVNKEDFVKKLMQMLIRGRCSLDEKPHRVLLEDGYDVIRGAGIILLDEAEIRQRIKEFEETAEKTRISPMKESMMSYSRGLLAAFLRKEILGEESE